MFMKLLIISLFLTGCSYNFSGAKIGNFVIVKSGPLENCVGKVEDYFTWIGPCQFDLLVNFETDASCSIIGKKYISSCDLRVMK